MKRIAIILIFGCLALGCGSKKKATTKRKTPTTKRVYTKTKTTEPKPTVTEEPKKTSKTPIGSYSNSIKTYIDHYSVIAKEEMRKHKIPASITLAQGILESGSGKGTLAVNANNHFGIKCHGWNGKKVYHDDDAKQECFRKYNHVKHSFEDHSDFLTSRYRYAKLFKLKQNDYKAWAKGLRAAGYATDKKYPQKLISLIERFELYKYDQDVLGGDYKPVVVETQKHKVEKGETLYSISKKYNLTVDKLKTINNLTNNILKIGQLLIITL